MKKKLLSIIVLFVFSATAFSQTDSIPVKKWIIKWNNTAAIDIFSFPTVQFAVEKKFNNYVSFQTEFGIQLYELGEKADTTVVNVGGYKINAEGRFYAVKYFRKNKSNKRNIDGLYVGIQAVYRENKYNAANFFYIEQSNVPGDIIRFSDYFGVIKKAYGANVALGYQKSFLTHFVLEPYVYIGYMNKKIKNINREVEKPTYEDDNGPHDFFGDLDEEESSGTFVNFSFGIRWGYQF